MSDEPINYLPRRVEETAYTITPCRACDTCSAVELDPPRYVCAACGETGVVEAGGWANVPDAVPDKALKARFDAMCVEQRWKEFRKHARARRQRTLKLLQGGKT